MKLLAFTAVFTISLPLVLVGCGSDKVKTPISPVKPSVSTPETTVKPISLMTSGMGIPTDVNPTCVVDPLTFESWFVSGETTNDGPVNPTSSVTFTDDNPNGGDGPQICNFYQWGAQMFLWLTSPEGDGLVLDGPSVFTVSASTSGQRTLIPNPEGAAFAMELRAGKSDEEVGQAGSAGVLLSQGKSLVYYGIHVNDVYGYFLSGQKSGALPDARDFPHNATDLSAVVNFAQKTYGVELSNSDALVMELKTSWVDASTLTNADSYVTVQADVPAYTADSTNTLWEEVTGEVQSMKLALTGVHIVGTVQDHPEFVWASFEHVGNAPDAAYYYENATQDVVQQPFSSAGDFVFMETGGSLDGANTQCASAEASGNITGKDSDGNVMCTGGIVPSNTVRLSPWGSLSNDQTTDVVTNNTRLLSINNSVRTQLSSGDVRANYVQIGGLWTTTPPAGGDAPIPNQGGDQSAQLRGSLSLANSTMETYTQVFGDTPSHCFSCHQLDNDATDSFGADKLSHIFSQIAPL
jgi:hypothetical protein